MNNDRNYPEPPPTIPSPPPHFDDECEAFEPAHETILAGIGFPDDGDLALDELDEL